MKNWQQVKSLIKKHEGLSLTLYKCPSGKQTIGYGHNIEDMGISEEVAELLLEQDTQIAYKQVRNAVKCFDTLNEARQYVLIDMCFNMGITKLMGFKKMLSALDKGDYKTAAKESATWNTQEIIDTANSSYQAFFTVRQFSLTYNGTTYYGQLPNIYELEQIYTNRIALDGYDPTINTDNNLTDWKFGGVASNVWSSTALASNMAYRITTFGSISSGTTTNSAALIPIIEIPV